MSLDNTMPMMCVCVYRDVFNAWGQRSGGRPGRRHGHHQRRGKPRARRGKERVLYLDFSLWQQTCKFEAASVSVHDRFYFLFFYFSWKLTQGNYACFQNVAISFCNVCIHVPFGSISKGFCVRLYDYFIDFLYRELRNMLQLNLEKLFKTVLNMLNTSIYQMLTSDKSFRD